MTGMGDRARRAEVLEVADGPPALAALREAIAAAQAGSPLAPVTVVVASNSVGVAARRWLAANGGIAAVQFVTLFRLAELLGAPSLVAAGRRPVNTPVVDVAVRDALATAPGMFAPVAHHHTTVTALRDAHRELRHVPEVGVERLGTAGTARAAEVVRVHRIVTARLAGGWYDEADLLVAARAHAADVTGPVLVFLPDRQRPTERALVDALAASTPTTVIVATVAPRSDAVVEVLDVSDADDEAREAVRQIVAATQSGVRLERMAVVWPAANPYARLITEHLDAAGIEWNGRPGTTLHERLAARLLLDVLALDRRGLRRADLFGVLAHIPARDLDGERVPAARWERLSRDAGLASDADWDGRLAGYERQLGQDPQRRGDAAAAARLREFVHELRALLGAPNVRAPWRRWAQVCDTLLDRWLGGPRRIARLPPVEHEAYGQVQAAVDRLGRLDELDGPVTRAVFLDALGAELDDAPGRVGRIGRGVQVGPLSFALGQTLDLVIVLGASEGQLPTAPRTDPLLADADRALTDGALPLSDESVDEQRRRLVAALAAAPRAIVLRPRGDLRATAVRQPSRWIAEIAAQVPIVERSVPSFAAGLADATFPATAGQHRVRALTHHVRGGEQLDTHRLADELDPLRSGLATVRAREADALTAYDGDLAGLTIVSPLSGTAAIAPTRLEQWAACPFGYFVRYVLGVRPVEHPDAELRIRPTDQGVLVHDALDRFHRRVLAGELPQPGTGGWDASHLAALLDEFEAAAAQMEAAGRVGRVAAWQAGRVMLRNQLRRWLERDSLQMVERRAEVLHSELAFGLGDLDPDSAPAATVELPSGRVARLRGKVDRVDRGADGTLYVVDHKTGSSWAYGNVTGQDPTAGGTKLQLPAYAAAVRQLAGDGEAAVRAEYSFLVDGATPGAWFPPGAWPVVGAAVERIVDGIEAGTFFALPERSQFRLAWVSCEFCDPDHLGTAERYDELVRKSADPRVRSFLGAGAEPDG